MKSITCNFLKLKCRAVIRLLYAAFMLQITCCESFLNVDVPNSKIASELAFADDAAANSAVIGIYLDMYRNGFANGTDASITSLAGLSADELRNNPRGDQAYLDFEENRINIANRLVLGLWTSMFKTLYETNAVLEGLALSTGVTPAKKEQLRGEALFVRAFVNLYLVNLFGNIPHVTSTDYKVNSKLYREQILRVYDQIKDDLISAEDLLPETYVDGDRIRPNRWAATALLARVYLYTEDWARAEDKATNVIARENIYSLPKSVNDVFLLNSREAIFQLKPIDGASATNEGNYFGAGEGPKYNVLTEAFVNSFEPNDLRRENWILTLTSGSSKIYLPFKYKKYGTTPPVTEYSVVLRLAEQYLIRAEARVRQSKVAEAIADIDTVRSRAGLSLINDEDPVIDNDSLLSVIEHERRSELFAEWGHRWIDLKRLNRAADVLRGTKEDWQDTDILYPVPQSEIVTNPNLLPQNLGY